MACSGSKAECSASKTSFSHRGKPLMCARSIRLHTPSQRARSSVLSEGSGRSCVGSKRSGSGTMASVITLVGG
eukprot:scaffold28728_cov60-Phaeocystis_antarctica.AAC.2